MLTIKTNALTEKNVLRPAVRKTIRENITAITLTLANGSTVELTNMGAGDYFGVVAAADDTTVNAKVELTITTNDYKAPTKKATPAKEPELIEVE